MSAEHAHSHGAGHISPVSLYVTIFLALMVLTAVTVGAAYVDLGIFNFSVAMLIASFKASLVIWYFMHVKYQSHLTKLTVATGLFFLAILLGMMLIDYTSKDLVPRLVPAQTDPMGEIRRPTH
ncbi:MAG TPA: cytochrome C oxidase subunit IV family protein [Vicinamibacterales bacterium]|nr:cytochrome C oxidase subunit IV family protein [Vicinamibacterales bacterium]